MEQHCSVPILEKAQETLLWKMLHVQELKVNCSNVLAVQPFPVAVVMMMTLVFVVKVSTTNPM